MPCAGVTGNIDTGRPFTSGMGVVLSVCAMLEGCTWHLVTLVPQSRRKWADGQRDGDARFRRL